MIVRLGDRVRIRIANISMDSHPIHVHGHNFRWTGSDGGPLPETAWIPETSINVPPGAARDVEFIADNPGDWAFHCHKVHHTMNQMGHNLPIMTGVDLSGVSDRLNQIIPGFVPMGPSGMGDMPDTGKPRNSLLMGSHEGRAAGPFGSIFMGGMFTTLKVRENLRSYDEDPGWYNHPAGTVASPVGPVKPVEQQPNPHQHHSSSERSLPQGTFEAVRASACASPTAGR